MHRKCTAFKNSTWIWQQRTSESEVCLKPVQASSSSNAAKHVGKHSALESSAKHLKARQELGSNDTAKHVAKCNAFQSNAISTSSNAGKRYSKAAQESHGKAHWKISQLKAVHDWRSSSAAKCNAFKSSVEIEQQQCTLDSILHLKSVPGTCNQNWSHENVGDVGN